jgi:hypothetical protein
VRSSAVLVALAAAAVTGCGETEVEGKPEPSRARAAKPLPPGKLPSGRGHVLARVRAPVLVHDRPSGRPFARLRPKTPFAGPRTLAIFRVRDKRRWLAVHSPVLGNDRTGWIQNDAAKLDLSRTRISLRVRLSDTQIDVRRGKKTLRSIPIAIGAAGTSTPTGRFQVTDKMPASRFPKGPYGCCIIALSARQANLPPGWAGGDRIAIHGTTRPETIGQAASNGCLRASDPDLHFLMRDVPVGAPVFIRP